MVDLQTILTYLTLISVPIGVAYHIMTLNNSRKNQQLQLETREAQLMMQLWSSWMNYRNQQVFWVGIEYEDFDDFWERYGSDDVFWKEHSEIMAWYENVGVLVKEGLLDIRLIALMYAGATRMFWEKLEPLMDGLKEKWKYPRLWSETEYLCKTLIKYMEEHPELAT